MKRCTKCRHSKPLDDFSPDARMRDGRQSHCKLCKAAAQATRYQENPEREKLVVRRCVAKRRDYYRETARGRLARERIEHPERVHTRLINSMNAWRAKRDAPTEGKLTAAGWRSILAYFNHTCAYCLNGGKMTQDHILPLSRGGTHTAGNVVPACALCNSRKNDRPLWRVINEIYVV